MIYVILLVLTLVIALSLTVPKLFLIFESLRKKRDLYLWQQWNEALRVSGRQGRICRIQKIRQYASTGTKGYLVWYPGWGGETAFWIRGRWPVRNQYLVVEGRMGDGPHHSEPVYYVNHIHLSLPKYSYEGWCRHEERSIKELKDC